MHELKAIIFDVDGTLAATEETHRQAFNQAFDEFQLPFHWSVSDYIEQLAVSGGKERIYKFLKGENFTAPDGEDLRDFTSRLHQRKSEIYREKLDSDGIDLRCGVERLVREARDKGIIMAIATSTSTANVETVLKNAMGGTALNYFNTLVSCDIVTDKKPSPAVYQYALANLGLKPENCIVIEDTQNGNLAAIAAGMKTIITTHPLTVDEDFSGASLVLDQLGEPDNPFTVTSGNAYGEQFVTIELLEKILSATCSATKNNDGETNHQQENLAVAAN